MPRVLSGRVILYLLILLILDLSISPFFRIGFLKPTLGYLMILYATFEWGIKKTIPVALAVGFLRDLANSQHFGIEILSCVTAAVLLERVIQKIERTALFFRFFISFLFVLMIQVFNFTLSYSVAGGSHFFWNSLGIGLGTAVYTCTLLPVFFYLTARWFHDSLPVKQYELFQ